MTAFNQVQLKTAARASVLPSLYEKSQITQIRLCLYIPNCYLKEPVISRLISNYGLVVNITGAMLGAKIGEQGRLHLEIRGSVSQISKGLAYLESLNLKIVGKPNVDGDSWSC
ncbi:hypothetical protein BV372_27130 [Nostoc sp. T09]|uniref:NIL domain-containing protein n=1 Tax=Nostoc sp. T09 TaxID=1932621 RepID=UPI000A394D49|nr:NIL domain-containing protein [Nostoc sp. T09]OUL26162.1 hypothetical protein BV372_27130 [Nostoc sp. T09]